MGAGILTLISVVVNAVTAIVAPLVGRKLAAQKETIQKTEDKLAVVGSGLRVIERAVEENKDALSRTGAGNRIARTIRTYGPMAKQLVDSARDVARHLREEAEIASQPGADKQGIYTAASEENL